MLQVYCDFHGIVVLRNLYALRLYFVLCLQKYGHILNGNSTINGSCTPSSEKRYSYLTGSKCATSSLHVPRRKDNNNILFGKSTIEA